jgi:hypothetical protein
MVLINFVLSSQPIFILSFLIPRGISENRAFFPFRSRFFWQNVQYKKKCMLAQWSACYVN